MRKCRKRLRLLDLIYLVPRWKNPTQWTNWELERVTCCVFCWLNTARLKSLGRSKVVPSGNKLLFHNYWLLLGGMTISWRHKCFTRSTRANVIVLKPVKRLTLIRRALKTILIEDRLQVLNWVLMKRCPSLQLNSSLCVPSRLQSLVKNFKSGRVKLWASIVLFRHYLFLGISDWVELQTRAIAPDASNLICLRRHQSGTFLVRCRYRLIWVRFVVNCHLKRLNRLSDALMLLTGDSRVVIFYFY